MINLISKIEHIKLSHLTSIVSTSSGLANIVFTESFKIPFSKSSARYNVEAAKSSAGRIYEISLSANLKEEIADLEPGVFLVTMENGTTYIIGSKDYPVRYLSDESLTIRSFKINYKSKLKPLKKAN